MDKPQVEYPKLLLGRPPKSLQELYINKSRWNKGSNGKNAQGDSVDELHPDAVSWCLSGALSLAYYFRPELTLSKIETLAQWVEENTGFDREPDQDSRDYLVGWNDDAARTFQDVRQAVVGAGV